MFFLREWWYHVLLFFSLKCFTDQNLRTKKKKKKKRRRIWQGLIIENFQVKISRLYIFIWMKMKNKKELKLWKWSSSSRTRYLSWHPLFYTSHMNNASRTIMLSLSPTGEGVKLSSVQPTKPWRKKPGLCSRLHGRRNGGGVVGDDSLMVTWLNAWKSLKEWICCWAEMVTPSTQLNPRIWIPYLDFYIV